MVETGMAGIFPQIQWRNLSQGPLNLWATRAC